jgi:hypothetical protein
MWIIIAIYCSSYIPGTRLAHALDDMLETRKRHVGDTLGHLPKSSMDFKSINRCEAPVMQQCKACATIMYVGNLAREAWIASWSHLKPHLHRQLRKLLNICLEWTMVCYDFPDLVWCCPVTSREWQVCLLWRCFACCLMFCPPFSFCQVISILCNTIMNRSAGICIFDLGLSLVARYRP